MGDNSHAGGWGTIAAGENQTVVGKWNVADETSLFIVGCGWENDGRANALWVDKVGNLYIRGVLRTNCGGLNDDEISPEISSGTKDYTAGDGIDILDNAISVKLGNGLEFDSKMRISFGSDGRTFGCSKKPLKSATDYLSEVQKRLLDSGVVIEHKDFENLIKVYDRPTAMFYCDPPYHTTEDYYDVEFKAEDHIRLKDCLNSIKGRFLLSYNDDDFIRNLYKDFNILEVVRGNNLTSGKYKELLMVFI